jgi:DNA-directed RNA polymerase specialized sigma24 family protein
MARVEGLTARQIALRLGKKEEAVRQLLARALKRLKRTMGDTESLHLPDKSLGKEGPQDA